MRPHISLLKRLLLKSGKATLTAFFFGRKLLPSSRKRTHECHSPGDDKSKRKITRKSHQLITKKKYLFLVSCNSKIVETKIVDCSENPLHPGCSLENAKDLSIYRSCDHYTLSSAKNVCPEENPRDHSNPIEVLDGPLILDRSVNTEMNDLDLDATLETDQRVDNGDENDTILSNRDVEVKETCKNLFSKTQPARDTYRPNIKTRGQHKVTYSASMGIMIIKGDC